MIGHKILFALSVVTGIFAQPQPKAPGLTYLYTSNVTLGGTIDYGDGPKGRRTLFSVVGGTFSGPKLKGTIIQGEDWGTTDTSGNFYPDVRSAVRTDDGADLYLQTSGTQRGDVFHLAIKFETGNANYTWLNTVAGVGILRPGNGYAIIETWAMESP
ncbi:hypothetical protein BKA64DRAFT_714215 [Cadophora sp. MPI-SDFR-AT-0126]|nr:hypothetical protein BKA64DRAFT_714215 [Leotiomycetes sp. MPI-SDFR-AT-0126]